MTTGTLDTVRHATPCDQHPGRFPAAGWVRTLRFVDTAPPPDGECPVLMCHKVYVNDDPKPLMLSMDDPAQVKVGQYGVVTVRLLIHESEVTGWDPDAENPYVNVGLRGLRMLTPADDDVVYPVGDGLLHVTLFAASITFG